MTWYETWMKERMAKGAEANKEFYAAPSTKAIAPFRIADDLYYVGDQKVCAHLIRTDEGLILIDAGYPEAKHLLWESIIRLGFDPADVRWLILTHGHSDHYGELSMMLRNYDENSNFKINNIYFDFPDFVNSNFDPDDYTVEKLDLMKELFDKYAKVNDLGVENYYNALNGAVVNANSVANGLTMEIDGVKLEILQTWCEEDDQVNGNSMVIRVRPENPNGKTCLFLNDVSIVSGARLLKTYGEQLKSDVVQMSHHGQAGADKDVYDMIDAKIRLWPTPFWVWGNEETYKIGEVRGWVGVDADNLTENDLVACEYKAYPEDYTSVDDWKQCVQGMKILLD